MGGAGATGQTETCARTYRRRQPERTPLYAAVRENLVTLVAEADTVGRGLPRYVVRDFSRYLDCGQLANGFARVRCETCHDELQVAFSCKGRGVCPSCNAKRAHGTAAHLVERVLPHVPYRQWTLSFPFRLRLALARDAGLLSDALTLFLRAVFALQRRRARRRGVGEGQTGAVTFVQRFGSALQLTPHFHALLPDGVFTAQGAFVQLPPPTQEEVEGLLVRVRPRVLALLAARGVLEADVPDDALEGYRAHSLRGQLALMQLDVRAPTRQQPRCAFLEGFSLHANTHLHASDRMGLERLCRYGARGPLALERFERTPDGRIAYRMKRALAGGRTHLHFTGLELLRKLTALVPPPRSNLVRFHGVFAPGAKLRSALAPPLPLEAAAPGTPAVHVPRVEAARVGRTPRLDWAGLLRRTFALDVFLCTRCGGRRRVLAYLTNPTVVRAILAHVGEPTHVAPLAAAQGPPEWE